MNTRGEVTKTPSRQAYDFDEQIDKTALIFHPKDRLASFLEAGLGAEGFQIDRTDATAALEFQARHRKYGLIVIGVDSVTIEPMEICCDLRRRGIESPIMILSEVDCPDAVVGALRNGADDYLRVPFSFDEFLARAEALMRRSYPMRKVDGEVRVGDLVVDRVRLTVRRGEDTIQLTPREYKLLTYLMSAPGQVFSRTRIHERVWGYDRDPLTNVVEVYIRRLRTKIDAGSTAKLLHTVRGFGYKIEAVYN